MKNQNEIIEDIKENIKSLQRDNPAAFKGLKKELKTTFADVSTDDEDNNPKNQFSKDTKAKELPTIIEEALKGDGYGNSPLSIAIEEGKIDQVRKMYLIENSLSDADLLRAIAVDMMDKNVQIKYDLSRDIFFTVYSEAKYQLNLMGEDIDALIDAYDLD